MTLAQTYQGHWGRVGVGAFAAALGLCLALPAPADGEDVAQDDGWDHDRVITVPSGQSIEFLDVIKGQDSAVGTALRYRFLAPAISRNMAHVSFTQAADDMEALCQDYVLPQLDMAQSALPDQIIIVLADRKVEFGMADPDATQYFEAYRPEDGACFWEGF